jgi:hypothetical protein
MFVFPNYSVSDKYFGAQSVSNSHFQATWIAWNAIISAMDGAFGARK